jgi:hypothetical protein
MKLFTATALGFLLAGCDSRSIHSTYLTMKGDILWLQSFCPGTPQPPEISYKGSSAYINLYCDTTPPSTKWITQLTNALKEKGWVNMERDGDSFCNPTSGVKVWLPSIAASEGLTRQSMGMRFPDQICAKFRPNPFQPLDTGKEPTLNNKGD